MKNLEYESRERSMLFAQLSRNDIAPLSDRKEAGADTLELMRDPERVQRNLEWCLAGHYGFGAMQAMQRIRDAKRGNRTAQAMQLLAGLDCFCPQTECIKAWKQLTDLQKTALDTAILSAFAESLKGE